MPNIQIKTVEKLIIRELRDQNFGGKAYAAFSKMLQHFSDDEILFGIEHTTIITTIYLHNFYRYHSAEALSRELHMDVKALLLYRKAYARLFAKFYLDLPTPTATGLFFLYESLIKKGAQKISSQKTYRKVTAP